MSTKQTKTIRAYEDFWEKAKTKASNEDKTISDVINGFLAEYTDQEIEESQGDPFLSHSELSDKRKKIIKILVKKGISEINKQRFFTWVKGKNIYSRNDYIKDAMKDIDNDKAIPYAIEGEKLVAKDFECYCGAKLSVKALAKSDGTCPNCQTKLIDLKVGMDGFKVLD